MVHNTIEHKAANAIIANLSNTEQIGIVNGKMALCLFLYKYSLKSRYKIYSDIPYILFNEITTKLQSEKMATSISYMAEIGTGFWELYDEGFFNGHQVNGIIHHLDEMILKRPYFLQSSDRKRNHNDIFFQGIYFLKRIRHKEFGIPNDYQIFSKKVKEYIENQDETLLNRSALFWRVVQFVFDYLHDSQPNVLDCEQITSLAHKYRLRDDEIENHIRGDDLMIPYILCQILLPKLGLPDCFSKDELSLMLDKIIENSYYNKYSANAEMSILSIYLMSKTITHEN